MGIKKGKIEHATNPEDIAFDEGFAYGIKLAAEFIGPAIAKEFEKRMPIVDNDAKKIRSLDFWSIPLWSNCEWTIYLTPVVTWMNFILNLVLTYIFFKKLS